MGNTVGAKLEGDALKAEARINTETAKMNLKFAEFQSKDALRKGRSEEKKYRQYVSQVIGSQRARMAAAGIEIDEGSALDVQTDAAAAGEQNALQIRINAMRQAFGFREVGLQGIAQAQISSRLAKSRARAGLLIGGLSDVQQAARAAGSA